MKKLLTILLLSPILLLAQQSKIAEVNTCTKFIEDKMDLISFKIYEGILSGAIIAYDKDTFTKEIHKDTIALEKWTYYESEIYDSVKSLLNYGWGDTTKRDSNYAIIGYDTLKRDFNPQTDFEGLEIITETIIDTLDFSIRYKIEYISICYPVYFEGMKLNPMPVFALKLNEIENYLDKETFLLFKSLVLRRISLYKNENNSHYPVPFYLENFENLSSRAYNTNYTKYIMNEEMDTIMADYYLSLLSFMAVKMNEDKKPLFKDSKLNEKYKSIYSELGHHSEFEFESETTTFYSPFTFRDLPFYLIKNKQDCTICLKNQNLNETEFNHICFSYYSAKSYLQPFDRIILESLFKYILMEGD